MAAREVVLKYLSTFDASGAQAAQKGNVTVGQSVDFVRRSQKGLADQSVDLELKQRRVEAVTRNLANSFSSMAVQGFSASSAAGAAASAIGFVGNAVKIASGPIGIAVTVVTALASALLVWWTNADNVEKKTKDLATTSEIYAKALETVANANDKFRSAELESIQRKLKLAKTQEGLKSLMDDAAKASQALTEAEDKLSTAQARRAEILVRLHRIEADPYAMATQTSLVAAMNEQVRLLDAEIIKLSSEQNKAKESSDAFAASVRVTTTALSGVPEVADQVTDSWKKQTAAVNTLGAAIASLPEIDAASNAKRKAYSEDYLKKRVAMERAAAAQIGSIAGSLAAFMAATGSQQFGIMKGLRYAEAVINTAAGVAVALGSGIPWPYNLIAAAATAAAGAVQIATIASTSPGGGGGISIPSGGGGGGGGAQPAFGGGGVQMPITGGGGGGFQAGTVTIHFENIVVQVLDPDAISPAMMRKLVRRIAEGLSFELNGLRNSFQ